jgi:putative nucleotidyltransferase with HDIG domain
MLSVKGDLQLMTLPELLQWAEMNQKDGTLSIINEDVQKYFFFQLGKLIYFTSQEKSEKLGEHLIASGLLKSEQLAEVLQSSKKLNIPFTAYLITEKIFTRKALLEILEGLARSAIIEALRWRSGTFEFKEEVPPTILNGPLQLDITHLLFVSSVASDEADAEGHLRAEQVLNELERRITLGRIQLPPTPEIIKKLNRAMQDENTSFNEISKIILADQILVSKVLKVINSPFYGLRAEVTSLPRAISIMGPSAVKSIATAHAMSTLSQANPKKIKAVLHHCLLSAFIANQLAKSAGIDADDAFVCAILHDIGKTVLIEYLALQKLPESLNAEIIEKHHARTGYLLTREWQLSEIVQESVHFHHTPQQAEIFPLHVLVTYYANLIANRAVSDNDLQALCQDLQTNETAIRPLIEKIDTLDQQVTALL